MRKNAVQKLILITWFLLAGLGPLAAEESADLAKAQVLCGPLVVSMGDKCEVAAGRVIVLHMVPRVAMVCVKAAPVGAIISGESSLVRQADGSYKKIFKKQRGRSSGECLEARQYQFNDVCGEAVGFQRSNGVIFAAKDWLLKVYSPYSGDMTVATCPLLSL